MKSYAKINSFLKIVGTRDNYHEIASRFVLRREIYDEIFFEKSSGFALECDNENIENNIVLKAKFELEKAGFEHYEISNFSKPGFESQHNLMYWDNAEYFGIGAGASGYVNGVRYKNHGPIRHYLEAVEKGNARVSEEHLSKQEMMEEEMFLGLRKKSGVSKKRFEEKFGISFEQQYGHVVTELTEQGLLVPDKEIVRMTKKGLFLGDTVAEKFILE